MDASIRWPRDARLRPTALIACRAGCSSRLRRQARAPSAGAGALVRCAWNERLHSVSLELQTG